MTGVLVQCPDCQETTLDPASGECSECESQALKSAKPDLIALGILFLLAAAIEVMQ